MTPVIPSRIGALNVVKELPMLLSIGSIRVDVSKGVVGGDTMGVGQLFTQKNFKGLNGLETEKPQLLVKGVEAPDQVDGCAGTEMFARAVTEGIGVPAEAIVIDGLENPFDFGAVANESARQQFLDLFSDG